MLSAKATLGHRIAAVVRLVAAATCVGQVVRPGEFPLAGRTAVLLDMAGGVRDFAKTNSILIVRVEEDPLGGQLGNVEDLEFVLDQVDDIDLDCTVVGGEIVPPAEESRCGT